jgi:threonine synthase
MRYLSTRGGEPVSPSEAIVHGISPNGGLYVPESYPEMDMASLCNALPGYAQTALAIMTPYLSDTESGKIAKMIQSAYASFDAPEVVPNITLSDRETIAELWHGPTMAFKDVALQMLPHLMKNAMHLTGEDKTIYILVATSGDTGKAALEGFKDVYGTRVLVFYPFGGVSKAQRLQMVTQQGNNVDVCAVRGNFDDAQTGVKQIFASDQMRDKLGALGYRLSSANSINFGRLLPQIVYYFTSYLDLVRQGRIHGGEEVNFCVPTGNFGDILAGEYARRMGLPVHKLICASNQNNVLTDFFHTGIYDDQRPFYKSMSCSIDILISSNLERLLFETASRDPQTVANWMKMLREKGNYKIDPTQMDGIGRVFTSGWCSEADTLDTIRRIYENKGYLMDPHTAVAQTVYERYTSHTGDDTPTVLLSTANPFKFASDVLKAFERPSADDFDNVERLQKLTGMPVPKGIAGLRSLPELHLDVCDLGDMPERVLDPVLPGTMEGSSSV